MLLDIPGADCPFCPRLAEFRAETRASYPSWHNAPVPAFGSLDAAFLIVGLAPGLRGANRTGRPFTGDYAGDTLYAALKKYGFATGTYAQSPDDGLRLIDCRITNAARCVPPQNKPLPEELNQCRPFLKSELAAMPNWRVILTLGHIGHQAVVKTLGLRQRDLPFGHGRQHDLGAKRCLIDSYHCSRYNTNTGVLTMAMFEDVIAQCRAAVDAG